MAIPRQFSKGGYHGYGHRFCQGQCLIGWNTGGQFYATFLELYDTCDNCAFYLAAGHAHDAGGVLFIWVG